MEYTVIITETLKRKTEVSAESRELALYGARKKYYNCDIILDSDDFDSVDFELVEERNV